MPKVEIKLLDKFIISWQKSTSKDIADSPILSLFLLNLLTFTNVLTSHDFYHLIITHLLFLLFLEPQFKPTFEKVITLKLFGIVWFSFSAIRVRIDVLTKLNHGCLLMACLSFDLLSHLSFILGLKVPFLTCFGVKSDWLGEMSSFFVIIAVTILSPLKQILNARPCVILFVAVVCFDRRRSTFLSLHHMIDT